MKKNVLIFCILFSVNIFSQKDSLSSKDKYWEDQLYINITYNILNNQPENVAASEISYGFGLGYIKDIPLNKANTWALGVGLGYNYDFFRHNLIIGDDVFTTNDDVSSNKLKLHNLEFPIQIRWRTSDAVTYSFWRVYMGVKMNYNLSNKFSYILEDQDFVFKNINSYNKFQTGLELSAGYGAFNFYIYYGLSTMFKDEVINNEIINTKTLKLGLIFYLL